MQPQFPNLRAWLCQQLNAVVLACSTHLSSSSDPFGENSASKVIQLLADSLPCGCRTEDPASSLAVSQRPRSAPH